jgi:hypothetical protein
MGDQGLEKVCNIRDPWRPRCTLGVTSELNFLFQIFIIFVIKNECQIIFNGKRNENFIPVALVCLKLFSFLKKLYFQLSTHRLHLGRRGSKNVNKHKQWSPIKVVSLATYVS